ncbi:MAG: ABC transporter permease [Proteobacteria bacterium]|nr:ABC transporter permease [Pseudomonadota bacterium]
MASAANVFHLAVKELRSLWHDTAMLMLMVFAFTASIYTAASSIPETLHRAPLAIVDEDHSALSARIHAAFAPPYFLPPPLISQAEVDPALDAGRYTFVLDIPPNFQRDVVGGRQPVLQLNVDATRMSQAFTGSGYVQAIVNGEIAEFLLSHRTQQTLPVNLAIRNRFNPTLSQSWFGAIAELINNITMLGIVLTGAALIREREHGTIEHLLAMPVTPFEIMAAKVLSMGFVVLLASTLSLIIVVHGLLAVPLLGSPWLFVGGAALQMFAVTSIGIFIGTVARSMPQMGLLLILVLLPLEMLSGGMTPQESMPKLIRIVMLAAPTTHFVNLSQAILFRGAGLDVVWPSLLAIATIGTIFFLIALALLRWTIGRMT